MIEEKDVMVPTRAGPRIAVRIYRPEGSARAPALYAASPYRYDNNELPQAPMFRWRETGPIQWYVDRQGYAYVHADVVGTGRSEGEYRFLDRREQEAHYDVIEWIARQPWSNGKVGGIGQSYYCVSQWFMGIQSPPHLACLGAYDGWIDPYSCTAFTGGIEKAWFSSWFNSSIRISNLFPANGAAPRVLSHDIACDALQHPLYDDYWRERAAIESLEKITVPVYSIGVWAKQELHLRGNIIAYQRLRCPKKLFVSATATNLTALQDFNSVRFQEEVLLPFYDHYLKGRETSYLARPPVEFGVRNSTIRRSAETWPPPGVQVRRFFLHAGPSGSVTSLNDGALKTAPAGPQGGRTSYTYPDLEWASGIAAVGPAGPDAVRRILTFTSDPLPEDVELAGNSTLRLFVSTTGIDTDFIVRVSEQLPQSPADRQAGVQPRATTVAKGWLRASHRERDPRYSTDEWPVYTHASQQFLTPGEIYQIDVPLMPMAYLFKRGRRIRVEVANHDSPVTDQHFSHFYKPAKIGTDTIYHSDRYPSHLAMQVWPRTP
jgi:predicted acyl esterase